MFADIKSATTFIRIESGLTIVPTKAYTIRTRIKIELGIGTWRKKEDRREYLKKREAEREMRKFRR